MKMSGNKGSFMYCDEHVPRGCSCNMHDIDFDGEPDINTNVLWYSKEEYERWLNDKKEQDNPMHIGHAVRRNNSFYYEYLDEKNRREPCCEIEYDKDGFDMEETIYLIDKQDVNFVFESHKLKYLISLSYAKEIRNMILAVFKDTKSVLYNDFMTKMGDISRKYFKIGYHSKINNRFYNSVKYKLREKRYKDGI